MRLNVDFHTTNDFTVDMGSVIEVTTSDHNELINRDLSDQHPIGAITGLQEALANISAVEYNTTAYWNEQLTYIPSQGTIVAYSDYATEGDVSIPNFKIGDGLAYLVDLPFVGDDMRGAINEHIQDVAIHLSAADRAKWDNKVSCDISPTDNGDYLLAFITG